MAIINRTLGADLQKIPNSQYLGLVSTGTTFCAAVIPCQSTFNGMYVSAQGLSGSPTFAFWIQRFIVGTGVTSITGGWTTLTVQATGTSGSQLVVQATVGSTLLNLLSGDQLMITTGGSNTACFAAVAFSIQATQDIRTTFGF